MVILLLYPPASLLLALLLPPWAAATAPLPLRAHGIPLGAAITPRRAFHEDQLWKQMTLGPEVVQTH